MNESTVVLVDALRTRGVIPADAAPPTLAEHDRPWFIALLQGFAGWLAGVFLLVFVALILKPESTNGIVFCGLFLLGGAWGLYYAARNIVFLEQLALALSIAGQFALAWAIMKDNNSPLLFTALLFVMQCAVFAVMPNRQARTLSALFATIAWVYLVRFWLMPNQSHDRFLFGDEGAFAAPRFGAATAFVAWFVTWVPVIAKIVVLLRTEARWMARNWRAFARPALAGLLIAASLASIVTEPLGALLLGIDESSQPFSWFALFPLLSIGLALFAAYAAFRVRSAGLLGFAVVAALVHLSRFYYQFGTSLLAKSLIMLLVGAVLLAVAVVLSRRVHS